MNRILRNIFQHAHSQALTIIVLGCLVGLLVNFVRSDGLHLVGFKNDISTSGQTAGDGLRITVEEAEAFFLSGIAVFLDTRDRSLFEERHIEGAKSLPWGEFDANYEKVLEEVEKDAYIICYCDGTTCNSSEHVAVALIEKGYANVYVLFNGWALWQEKELPIEIGPDIMQP